MSCRYHTHAFALWPISEYQQIDARKSQSPRTSRTPLCKGGSYLHPRGVHDWPDINLKVGDVQKHSRPARFTCLQGAGPALLLLGQSCNHVICHPFPNIFSVKRYFLISTWPERLKLGQHLGDPRRSAAELSLLKDGDSVRHHGCLQGWLVPPNYRNRSLGTSLAVQGLRLCLPMQDAGSIPGRGAGIPHASWTKTKNIKQKQCCNKKSIKTLNMSTSKNPKQKRIALLLGNILIYLWLLLLLGH